MFSPQSSVKQGKQGKVPVPISPGPSAISGKVGLQNFLLSHMNSKGTLYFLNMWHISGD